MKRIAALFLFALSLGAMAGCNTMEGFGKDLSELGDRIKQKSSRQ